EDFARNRGRAGQHARQIERVTVLLIADPDEALQSSIQDSLGTIYRNLAALEDRENNLQKAIAAYQAALTYRTPERLPLEYAATQNNLGIAYGSLATMRDQTANLHRAIAAYQAGLMYCSSETVPLEYAAMQSNLGVAYRDLAAAEDKEANLRRAIV